MASSANLRIGPGRASGSRTAQLKLLGGEDGDTRRAKSACQATPALTSQGVPPRRTDQGGVKKPTSKLAPGGRTHLSLTGGRGRSQEAERTGRRRCQRGVRDFRASRFAQKSSRSWVIAGRSRRSCTTSMARRRPRRHVIPESAQTSRKRVVTPQGSGPSCRGRRSRGRHGRRQSCRTYSRRGRTSRADRPGDPAVVGERLERRKGAASQPSGPTITSGFSNSRIACPL